MKKLGLGVLALSALAGCHQGGDADSGKFSNAVPLSKDLLVHEWVIDPEGNSNEFYQDFVYFTEDNKFWRCSYHHKTYLIDSSLDVRDGGKIYEKDKLKYTVYSLDSNQIALVSPDDKVVKAKMKSDFSKTDIQKFVELNPKKKLINGEWELSSSEYTPTKFPSFCTDIAKGAKFIFHPDATLEIYQKDSTAKCGKYVYKLYEDELHLLEGDMVVTLKLNQINHHKMVLRANFLRDDDQSEQGLQFFKNGYKIELVKVI